MAEIFVCNIDELREERGKKFFVEGEEIVIFKTHEEVFAISNICPHQKFAKLHEGTFENGILTCPMHGWSFDVKTGNSIDSGGKLKKFSLTIKNEKVFVNLNEDAE